MTGAVRRLSIIPKMSMIASRRQPPTLDVGSHLGIVARGEIRERGAPVGQHGEAYGL